MLSRSLARVGGTMLAVLFGTAFWGPAPALSQGKGEGQGAVTISFVATGAGADSLSAGDVKLSADGKDQSVTSLKKVAASGGSAASKLPPHTFSNRSEGGGGAADVVVVLLDGVNTQWKDDAASREATLRALEQIKPEEHAAIFVFGKTLQMLSDFTDDGPARAAKIKDFASAEPAGAGYKDLVRPIPQSGPSRAGMYEEQERMRATLATLTGLAGNLKALSGRKNLLWVSADFPLLMVQFDLTGTGRQSEGDVQRSAMDSYYKAAQELIRAFQAAGVAVYPVDARPLSLNPTETKSRVTYVNPPTADTTAAADAAKANRVPINDLMKELANTTGGAVFSDSKDIGPALRGALDDGESAYVATFTPSKLTENGALHKIKIQTKKGTQVRVAPGYFAQAAGAPLQPPQRLVAALSSPLNLSEIGMMLRVETNPADPAGLAVTLQVDPHDLDLTQQGDNWVGQVGVGSFQGNAGGEQFGKQMTSVPVTVSKADYQKALTDGGGIHFDVPVKRAPTATFLRFAVIDMKLPKAGSLVATLP